LFAHRNQGAGGARAFHTEQNMHKHSGYREAPKRENKERMIKGLCQWEFLAFYIFEKIEALLKIFAIIIYF
jgi:hypothetical protein